MTNVNIGAVEVIGVSTAVARGQAVMAALTPGAAVLIDTDETDGDEAVWSELVAYLGRRGVVVRYDHEAGYPVASVQVRS